MLGLVLPTLEPQQAMNDGGKVGSVATDTTTFPGTRGAWEQGYHAIASIGNNCLYIYSLWKTGESDILFSKKFTFLCC